MHEDTDNVHIHFIMNTVSYLNGHLYSEGIFQQSAFDKYVDNVLRGYTMGQVSLRSVHLFQDDGITVALQEKKECMIPDFFEADVL